MITYTVLVVNQPIHRITPLFLLHSIFIYFKDQTIVQPFHDIIIFMIYISSSDQSKRSFDQTNHQHLYYVIG